MSVWNAEPFFDIRILFADLTVDALTVLLDMLGAAEPTPINAPYRPRELSIIVARRKTGENDTDLPVPNRWKR